MHNVDPQMMTTTEHIQAGAENLWMLHGLRGFELPHMSILNIEELHTDRHVQAGKGQEVWDRASPKGLPRISLSKSTFSKQPNPWPRGHDDTDTMHCIECSATAGERNRVRGPHL
jgi:hypothetical protein